MVGLREFAWLAAEPLFQLFPFQPDEQLKKANVQMLADSLLAHSVVNHSDSLAAEGDTAPCWHFALARIGAAESCDEPVSSDRSGHDWARVNTGPTGCESWSGYVKLLDPFNFKRPREVHNNIKI